MLWNGRIRWKVVGCRLVRPVVAIIPRIRRGLGGSAGRNINQQSVVHGLAARIICVKGPAHRFVGLQRPRRLLFSITYAKG